MAMRFVRFDVKASKQLSFCRLGLHDAGIHRMPLASLPTYLIARGLCLIHTAGKTDHGDFCRNFRTTNLHSTQSPIRKIDKNMTTGSFLARHIFILAHQSGTRKRNLYERSMQTLPNHVKVPGDREIENHLQRLRIPYKNGYTSIVATCPNCKSLNMEETGGKMDKRAWNLFINKMTGKFICKKCGNSGAWNEIKINSTNATQQVIENDVLPSQNEKISQTIDNVDCVYKDGKFLSEASQKERDLIHERFKTENIDTQTFARFNVKVAKHEFLHKDGTKTLQTCLVIPWYDITSENVIALKLIPLENELSAKILPKKHSGSLFGSNCELKSNNQIILTASEFDAMAIFQSTGLNAMSLPAGTSILPPEVLPQLEQFERIILWFGNDSRSKQAINQFSKKLNMERCSFVRLLEDGAPSGALEALNRGLNLKAIISKAKSLKHKEILTFNQLREDVLGEFLNADEAAGVKWKRFPGLTSILKGHRRGELTILTGQTGTGKTTLLSELSLDLCAQGVNTLWGSFEIKNVRLLKSMMCQFSGLNLETSISQFHYWADKFDNLPLYFMSYFGAHCINRVLETMNHAAYVFDIEHIILDNLQFMMSSSSGKFSDRFSAMDHAISALRNFASSSNVHVTLVIHPRKENQDSELQTASIFGTAKASQEADNIVILQDSPGRISRRYLQVTKNRFDGAVGKVPLQFSRDSLCMSGFYRDIRTGKERFMTSNAQGNNVEKRDFVET